MTGSDPAANTLDVPGARLYYEQRGTGPLLVLIGSPMDSTGSPGSRWRSPAATTS